MKSRTWKWMIALSLLATLAMPVGMAAQNPSPDNKPKHKKYKLIDMGTFGGPASYLTTQGGVGAGVRILNNRGTVVGSADTTLPDPYSPACFHPDCFLPHPFSSDGNGLTDLGTLKTMNGAEANGINDGGVIVGVSQLGVFDPFINGAAVHAFRWRSGRMSDLGTLGGYESNPISINNAGDVVGFSTIDGPLDPYSFLGQSIHGFIWRNGMMRDVGTLGGPDTFPGFANELTGAVVGGSFTDSIANPTTGIPTFHPFLWRDGHMQDLGTLGGTACCIGPVVANSRGQVAGDTSLAGDLISHPFLWERGRLMDLGTLGGDNGEVLNINEPGDVVGNADLPGSQAHDAFLWRHGVMTDLGNLGRTSTAFAVNASGQVVGASRIDDTSGNARAFLWDNGGPIVDLNTLIPQNSPLLLVYAVDINERGEIAGVGAPAGCAAPDILLCGRAYLLIPNGDCDGDNEARIAASQAEAEIRRQSAPITTRPTEPQLSPAERFRSMTRQRYHIPGSQPLPLN